MKQVRLPTGVFVGGVRCLPQDLLLGRLCVQLELNDLKTNNHLKDLYKEITDLIHFYKTLTEDFNTILLNSCR
jgi:hypothetical protein